MRIALHRFAAPLFAWIPDISAAPARRQVSIGIAVSLLLHALIFLALVLLAKIAPRRIDFATLQQKSIELTIEPPAEEPKLLSIEENFDRPFLDPRGLQTSENAAANPLFESSENMKAASPLAATGDAPLPSQEGRGLFTAFDTKAATLGSPAAPLSTPLPSPPAEAPLTASLYKPQPIPKNADPQTPPALPPATPAPEPEKTPEPQQPLPTAPPPLKAVETPSDDEIVFANKPPATPAPIERPKPTPVPAPTTPVVPATPRPELPRQQQAMLVSPPPRQQPGYQPEQEKNHIDGNITNRGKSAVDAVRTPLGKYRKQTLDAIGSRWTRYVKDRADLLALGSVRVSFFVNSTGRIERLRIENNTSNQSFADVCERAIREAEIQPPPLDAVAPMRDGRLEYSINFTLYSFVR